MFHIYHVVPILRLQFLKNCCRAITAFQAFCSLVNIMSTGLCP